METDLYEINFKCKKIYIHEKYNEDHDDCSYESKCEFNFAFRNQIDESMLVCINESKLEYLFIDRYVAKFTAKYRIKHYYPSSERTGYKCPFAKDVEGNYYLFNFNVIMKIPKRYKKDPYDYYLDNFNMMTTVDGSKNYNNFGKVYMYKIDEYVPVNLTWIGQPKKDYETHKKLNIPLIRLIDKSVDCNVVSNHIIISKKEYVDIMKKYGKEKGLKYLKQEIVL